MNNNPTNHDNEKHKAVDWKTKSAETRSSTFETHSASHSQPNQTTSQGYQTASPKTSSAQTNRPKQPSPSYSLSNQNTTGKIRIKPLPVIIVIILLLVSFFIVKSCSSKENSSFRNSTHSTQSTTQQQESSQENTNDESLNQTSKIETTVITTTTKPETTTTTTTTIPTKMEYLANMELFADGSSNSTGGKSYIKNKYLTDNYRNTYSSSIGVESGYLSYLVKDMGYTHFCGTVGLPKEISTDGYKTSAQLEIYIDEVLAFRSEDMTNGSKPQSFDIDITGAEVIKLSWSCQGGNIRSNWCYFATVFDPYCADDAYIEKISGETRTTSIQVADTQYLANMELFANGSSEAAGGKSYMVNEYLEDNYGNAYKSSFGVKEGYVSYLVKDMGYTNLRGTIALPKGISADSYRTSAQLEIYLDDALALRSNEFTNESKPQEFDIDITGVEVIKFTWTCKGGNIWSNWCYYATVFDGCVTKES